MVDYLQQYPNILTQFKEWKSSSDGQIIFDSRAQNWSKSTSEFTTTLKGKKKIFIVINDMDGNIFGGFISKEITNENEWITDDNAFLFTIESNQRIAHPTKYPIKAEKAEHAFIMFGDDFDLLFQFGYGYDIVVCKQDHLQNLNSGVNETSFDFQKIKNPLITGKTFVPMRIVVIEMN